MMAATFQVGDLVWAKMKGFPPWPGKVSTPPENKRVSDKKPRCYIFFFGSENFAWVTYDNVWPYLENREKYMTLSRPSNSFQEAVDAMDNYIRENGGTVPETPEKARSPSPGSNQNDESLKLSSTKRSRTRMSTTPAASLQQSKVKNKEDEHEEGEGKEANLEEEAEGEDGEKPAKAGKMKEADVEVKAKRGSRKGKGKNENPEGEAVTVVEDSEKVDEEKMEVDSEEVGGGDAVVAGEEKKPDDEEKEKKDGDKDDHESTKKDVKEPETKKPVAPRASKRTSAVLKTDDNQKQTASSRSSKKAAYLPDVLPSATSAVTPSSSDITRLKTDVVPTTKKIGFLGVGEIGEALIGCLLATGHQVTVWNRTISKCKDLLKKGASKGSCPSDVVGKCDLTFACLSDAAALKDVVFGNGGVLQAITEGKGFINLSTVDVETTMDVCEAISSRGGRFLEAPIIGSREMSKTGQLLLLASGEQSLFDECSSCFKSIAKNVFNLVDLGMASKMQIVLNALYGTTLAGLAESLSLASKIGLDPSEVLEVLGHSSASSTLIREKGSDMVKNKIMDASCRLTTLQRDLRLAINMSEVVDQPLHVGSAVNELFKKAKAKGYGDADISAIYRAADL